VSFIHTSSPFVGKISF